MKLLGADSNLGAEAEFKTIGKACRSIDIYGSRINTIQEFSGAVVIFCNDCFGMTCIIPVYMFDGILHGVYLFYGQNIVQIFHSPVFFCGCFKVRYYSCGLLIGADFHLLFIQPLFQKRQEVFCYFAVYKQ